MMLDPAIGWIVALSLAVLLGSAAAHKLRDWARFRSALAGYRLVPDALVTPAAAVLVGAEVAGAVLLVLPAERARGAIIAGALMLLYAAAIGINLGRGRTRIDCGCFGRGRSEPIGGWMVGRNLALALAAVLALAPVGPRELGALDFLTVTGTVLAVALLYGTIARLASLRSLAPGATR